jgi:DNA polymerase III alpha subunit
VIEVAIVRPGPIQGGMVHPFLRRRDGLEAVTYPHPCLKPILERTCGVPIFQEQVMQIASSVAGFTPGEADELRRIMSSSWKKADLMKGLRERLINGMLHFGLQIQYAERIYQTIVGFSSYGFPESHSASFALLTYASCYLKCHFPAAFVVSLLNAQPMGFYSPRALIMDAQRHAVKFLDVDVQRSVYDYTLEDADVRVGFRALSGLREKHVLALVSARQQAGPFQDLSDLIRRTQLHKTTLMQLAAAGALNSLALSPREALWKIQALQLDTQSLFYAREEDRANDSPLLPVEGAWENLQRNYQTQGYSLALHPLGILRPALERWSTWERARNAPGFSKASQLPQLKNGTLVRVAGLLSLQQRPPTAKGFAFLTLEDESGLINIVLLPAIYQQFRLVIASSPLLHIGGRLEKVSSVINIKAEFLRALPVEKMLNSTPAALAPAYDFSKCVDDHTVG